MRGDVEICHQYDVWRIGIEGEPLLLPGRFRTLEEAIEVAWDIAAMRHVALHVGKDRADGGGTDGTHDALRPVTV